MSGDWIKMRSNLWDDPRVARLCDLTDCSEAAIVGGLYWLWATADQHSEDGIMPGLTIRSIDRKTGIQGFGDALVSIGWLADHPEGVRIVRFEEHNGKSAKRRCSESSRKMSARDADKMRTEEGQQEEITQQSCAPRDREEIEVNRKPPSLRDVPLLDSQKKKSSDLRTWLSAIKAAGEKPVSEYQPLWEYCRTVGIHPDWVEIAWVKFVDRYTADEKGKRKRYVDWRKVFLRALKENWLSLWFFDQKLNQFRLTTVGISADLETREAA